MSSSGAEDRGARPTSLRRDAFVRLAAAAVVVGVALIVLWQSGVILQSGDATTTGVSGVEVQLSPAAVLPEATDASGRSVGLKEGNLAPDFEFSDFDGARHRLSDYRGRAVLLNFWATWCVPCRAELPAMDTLLAQYGDTRLAVVAMNDKEGPSLAVPFIRRLEVKLTAFGYDPAGQVARRYAVQGLPTSYFIDPRGVITRLIAGQLSASMMQSGVEDALSGGQ